MRSTPTRARATEGGHVVVAGKNYGQGSSREHAVIAPRYLGLQAVIAVSFARIHWQNLANFGIVPLEFEDPADLAPISVGDEVVLEGVHEALRSGHHAERERSAGARWRCGTGSRSVRWTWCSPGAGSR